MCWVFFNSPTIHLWAGWVMCCSFVIPALLWLMFFNSPTQFPPISGIRVMCCSFVITCLRVFSTVLPNSYKAGIEWCAALCVTCVRVYFNSPTIPTYEAGIEWCAALLWFHVFEVFFNSPTQFPPMKQGLSDVLLFVIPRVRVFSTVLPNSTYGRD
jgi:hypothetical protein